METYDGDFGRLRASFIEFFKRLPFYGVAVVCVDDENANAMLPELHSRVVTYGTNESADIRGFEFQQHEARSTYKVARRGFAEVLTVALNMPGQHNMLNSLAAIAVASELRVPSDAIVRALSSFQGIGRRCQWMGDTQLGAARVSVIDDYGHHPNEIRVTIKAVRDGWPGRRILVAFQPHRFTRTRDLFEDFVDVLTSADVLAILEVYPAGETPIAGADGRALCRAIRLRGKVDPVFIAEPAQLTEVLSGIAEDGDILLLLGAGSIGRVAESMNFQPHSSVAPLQGVR
jgi:UDP-N-acetylmuramate--alanine ligase